MIVKIGVLECTTSVVSQSSWIGKSKRRETLISNTQRALDQSQRQLRMPINPVIFCRSELCVTASAAAAVSVLQLLQFFSVLLCCPLFSAQVHPEHIA